MVGGTWRSPGLALLLGGFFLVALWELFRPRRALGNPVTPRWLGNLAVYFINAALLAWVFTAPLAAAARIEARLGIELPRWPTSPSVLNFTLGFLFLDCFRYWLHRVFHVVPWLWRLHSLHHADSDLDVSTSFRHHPVEFLVGSAVFAILLVISGFPSDIAAAYLLSASLLTYCQHGNVGLPPSWEPVLQWIIVTPDMHRLHHSVVAKEANSNFGFMFSFWDGLFSTHRKISPAAHDDVQFGLTEIRNPSFARMLLLPLIVAPLEAGHYSKPALRRPSSR
jgi:sterol desaturase/sphingolipid hydroxylase (fatty acid hydroxylase superfamily)